MMGLGGLGWRDGVLVLAAVAAIYLVLMLLRLMRVGKAKPAFDVPDRQAPEFHGADPMIDLSRELPPDLLHGHAPHTGQAANIPVEDHDLPQMRFAGLGATAWAAERTAPSLVTTAVPSPAERAANRVPPPAPSPAHGAGSGDFASTLARSSVEGELQQLRRESATLRDEVNHLREELATLKAARNVSPLYSEAMAMAQRGITADGIAGQCGISLAEAELVAALARGDAAATDEPYPSGEDPNGGYPDPRSRTGTHG